jgi:hypothetical protein
VATALVFQYCFDEHFSLLEWQLDKLGQVLFLDPVKSLEILDLFDQFTLNLGVLLVKKLLRLGLGGREVRRKVVL